MHYIGHSFPQLGPEDIAKRAVERADALLAELAKRASAPAPDADGWVPHTPGDPMPDTGGAMLQVKFGDGGEYSGTAEYWQPEFEEPECGSPESQIVAWKLKYPTK